MNKLILRWCVCFVFTLDLEYGEGLVGTKERKEPFFRKDFEYIAFLGTFYKVHSRPRTWSAARTKCEREGSSLATPESWEEAREIQRLMDVKLTKHDSGAFIGMHDFLSEGEFVSLDGVPAKDVYHSWAAGEPNNANNNENCVLISRSGQLNDENCNTPYPFICKKSFASLEWNPNCSTYDKEYVRLKEMYTCHKLHKQPLNWTDAYATCLDEEGYLSVINSKTEERALVDFAREKKVNEVSGNYLRGALHLGYHNRFGGSNFVTIFGETLEQTGFSEWGGGQPDNAGGHELCGSMFNGGGLNDISCETGLLFICERGLKGAPHGLTVRSNYD